MDVDLVEPAAGRIDAPVPAARPDDQHLSCLRFHGVGADGELRLPLEDDEDLLVKMPMKPRTVPWLQVDEDKADVDPPNW